MFHIRCVGTLFWLLELMRNKSQILVVALLPTLLVSFGFARATDKKPEEQVTVSTSKDGTVGITKSPSGKGVPNGSSSDEFYLEWLVPTTESDYGFTKAKPIAVGGFLEGKGSRWSAQYFSSLLGPNGEPTSFERVGSCCAFVITDPKLVEAGFSTGFLDTYRVTIEGVAEPVIIYVTLYSESRIYAPKGFTTRGKKL